MGRLGHDPRRWRMLVGALVLNALMLGPVRAQSSSPAAEGAAAEATSPGAESEPGDGEETAGMDEAALPDPEALRTEGRAPDLLNAAGLSRGVDGIIAAIRKREVGLIEREQEVAERERAVSELEAIIDQRAEELDRIRVQIEERIASWAVQGPDRAQQLANVYASMPAVRAADLLGKLELDLAVSVVQSMKKKQSAGVLAVMRPDRALQISRRMLQPLSPQTDAPPARAK